jgi:hypothetical protein
MQKWARCLIVSHGEEYCSKHQMQRSLCSSNKVYEEYEKALERKAPVKLFVPPSDRLFDWMVGRTNPKIKLMDHQKFTAQEFMKKRGLILVHPTGSKKIHNKFISIIHNREPQCFYFL